MVQMAYSFTYIFPISPHQQSGAPKIAKLVYNSNN